MRVKGSLHYEDDALTPVSEHAADLIARTVMAQPGEIMLIAIGPLTNVALAMLKGRSSHVRWEGWSSWAA